MPAPSLAPAADQAAIRRELYFVTLYRILEAALLCLVVFGPAAAMLSAPRAPMLARAVAVGYLLVAVGLLFAGRRGRVAGQALAGVLVDIAAASLAMHALSDASAGIAMMLLFNVGAAAMLLPLRLGICTAALAAGAFAAVYGWSLAVHGESGQSLAELSMFSISFLAMATLTNLLGRQMRAAQALAERRGTQAANMAEVNELVIRRMRTGVLLVDGAGRVRLANEAAVLLLGGEPLDQRALAEASPALAARLARWRADPQLLPLPLQLAPDLPEVQPRFARLLAGDEDVLVFLDDTSLATQRAESLTLATLGRFSASLAHEIRNPLAAISYATQLMEESPDIPTADRRLLEIVYQQTQRMNGIVDNVLGLAKRERAQPEHLELGDFVRRFVADYQASHPLEQDRLDAATPTAPVPCMVDRRQLQQVLTVLVHNALVYGRLPGEPARVAVHARTDPTGVPLLEVMDRGPGIPDAVVAQLFKPFYTTSPHGTGLGLYIARELCLANQASLEYVPLPAGGACFRIRLLPPSGALRPR
ncbi:MAG TPA: ATP-binding protein [Thermomonas sp.]|nr:ATP-binding protein [Thermomonas sp.]